MSIYQYYLLGITICGYLYILCLGLWFFVANFDVDIFLVPALITFSILLLPLIPRARKFFYIFAGGWLLLIGIIFITGAIPTIESHLQLPYPVILFNYILPVAFGLYFLAMAIPAKKKPGHDT